MAERQENQRQREKKMGFGVQPAVLVVDMTYAYFDPRSDLGYGAEAGWKAVAQVQTLLAEARKKAVPIIYTRSAQLKTQKTELKGLGRKHADNRTPPDAGHMSTVVKELSPQDGDLVVDKFRASAFFGTPLISYLIFHRVDTLILTGTSTSGCIRTTAADASSYNYHVIIPEECVFDREPVWHDVTLQVLARKYADVMPLAELLSYLKRYQGSPVLG